MSSKIVTNYNNEFNYKYWYSNKTPKSIKSERVLTEYVFHCMKNFDFPIRTNYCWNFSEAHRNRFNEVYYTKYQFKKCKHVSYTFLTLL